MVVGRVQAWEMVLGFVVAWLALIAVQVVPSSVYSMATFPMAPLTEKTTFEALPATKTVSVAGAVILI